MGSMEFCLFVLAARLDEGDINHKELREAIGTMLGTYGTMLSFDHQDKLLAESKLFRDCHRWMDKQRVR